MPLNIMPIPSAAVSLCVLLVDDSALFRYSLRRLLEKSLADVTIIGEAGDGNVAIEMALTFVPHVIIMMWRCLAWRGIDVTDRMRAIVAPQLCMMSTTCARNVTREGRETDDRLSEVSYVDTMDAGPHSADPQPSHPSHTDPR